MIFNAFQRDDDDSVFTIVRNVSGAQQIVGTPVVWDSSSSVDGVRVSTYVTATLGLFRGILVETINDSAYGKCQVHGYNNVARVANNYTTAIAAGNILVPIYTTVANAYLGYSGAGDGKSGFVYAAAAVTTGTLTTNPDITSVKVLIRAL